MIYSRRRILTLFGAVVIEWNILDDTVQLLKTPAAPGHGHAGPIAFRPLSRVALGAALAAFEAASGENDVASLVGHAFTLALCALISELFCIMFEQLHRETVWLLRLGMGKFSLLFDIEALTWAFRSWTQC